MRNFQGIVFYMNTNIQGDFQICTNVPLTATHNFNEAQNIDKSFHEPPTRTYS